MPPRSSWASWTADGEGAGVMVVRGTTPDSPPRSAGSSGGPARGAGTCRGPGASRPSRRGTTGRRGVGGRGGGSFVGVRFVTQGVGQADAEADRGECQDVFGHRRFRRTCRRGQNPESLEEGDGNDQKGGAVEAAVDVFTRVHCFLKERRSSLTCWSKRWTTNASWTGVRRTVLASSRNRAARSNIALKSGS